MSDVIENDDLVDLIDSTVSIPTIPSTLLKLKEVCADEDSDATDIAAVIEHDPAVAAKVLRLVNSSFYALSRSVTAIPVACTILGRRVVQNVVLQATVLEQFSETDDSGAFNIDQLWDHSFKTAVATQMLASKSPYDFELTKDDAYTCGLMHDVGKVILHQSVPEDYCKVLEMSREQGIPLARAEDQLLGFNHGDVGGLLSGAWKLSQHLVWAIQFHHSASEEDGPHMLGMLIHCASSLAHQVAAEKDRPEWGPDLATPEELATLRVSDEDLDEIRDAVAATSLDA